MAEDNTKFKYNTDESEDTSVPTSSTYSWSSAEYIGHEHGSGWYMMLGLTTIIIGGLAYLLSKSYFAAGIIALVGVIVGVFASRNPNQVTCEISDEGLRIGEKMYAFRNFKSFTIGRSG